MRLLLRSTAESNYLFIILLLEFNKIHIKRAMVRKPLLFVLIDFYNKFAVF